MIPGIRIYNADGTLNFDSTTRIVHRVAALTIPLIMDANSSYDYLAVGWTPSPDTQFLDVTGMPHGVFAIVTANGINFYSIVIVDNPGVSINVYSF